MRKMVLVWYECQVEGRLILETHLLAALKLRRHAVQSCFEHGVSLNH